MTTPDEGRDTFTFLTYTWDVTAAARLAAEEPVRTFEVQSALQLLPFVRVDQAHAATVDLTEPVLLAYLKEVGSPLVIDGWHRVWRAWDTGVRTLPCRLLTETQEAQVRLYGGDKGLPPRAARRARLLEERGARLEEAARGD
jgi:hypothetical protein